MIHSDEIGLDVAVNVWGQRGLVAVCTGETQQSFRLPCSGRARG